MRDVDDGPAIAAADGWARRCSLGLSSLIDPIAVAAMALGPFIELYRVLEKRRSVNVNVDGRTDGGK